MNGLFIRRYKSFYPKIIISFHARKITGDRFLTDNSANLILTGEKSLRIFFVCNFHEIKKVIWFLSGKRKGKE